jgi:two-component system sensor histidine kinase KdpD
LLAFIVYFIVAVIASNLTARVREQAEAARRREDRTGALFALSRALASAPDTEAIVPIITGQVSQIVGADAVLLLNEGGALKQAAAGTPENALSDHDIAAAQWAWQHGQASGHGTDTLPGVAWMFLPLKTARSTVGVLGIRFETSTAEVAPRRRRLIEGLADQAAIGIESARLRQDIEQARVYSETERLRTALLSSVSHDLRTPLASIIGAASSLLAYRADYDETASRDLLQTIQEEAERLNRFVGNLLDVTRLESGKMQLNLDWVEIGDLVGSAIARARQPLANHRLVTDIQSSLPLLRLDFVLMEQVLFNLLDNAAKYSPPDTAIQVRAFREAAAVKIEIIDEGVGVPAADLERIFDKFYRVQAADRHVAGTGMGLSICRGIVEAHGGGIVAGIPAAEKGLAVTLRLPVGEQPRDAVEGRDSRG